MAQLLLNGRLGFVEDWKSFKREDLDLWSHADSKILWAKTILSLKNQSSLLLFVFQQEKLASRKIDFDANQSKINK